MKRPMHGAELQYKPYDFDDSSVEAISEFLVSQTELIRLKGITKNIRWDDWKNAGMINCNKIMGKSIYYGNMTTPYHTHDFYEINYVVDGTLVQYIDGKTYVMEKGDLAILPPGAFHVNYPKNGSFAMNILFCSDYIHSLSEQLSKNDRSNYLSYMLHNNIYLMFDTKKNAIIQALAEDLYEMLHIGKAKNKHKKLLCEAIGMELLIRLTECDRRDHIYTLGQSFDNGEELVERMLQYMRENYSTIKVERLSEVFGYSPQHIRRLMIKYTGNNVQFHVQKIRMNRATGMLLSTNMSVKDIADAVGLSTEYFSRRFKFEHGYSPLEYRKIKKTSMSPIIPT